MSNPNELFVDHEVRIRLLEDIGKDMKELRKDLHNEIKSVRQDMNSQFKWIIGTIIGLFCGTFLPLFSSIIFHAVKLT